MGRKGVIAVVGVLVALATGAVAWAASGPPTGPDPAVEEWPAWPYDTACEEGWSEKLAFDPVTAFSGRAEAEKGSSPSELALREFLEGQEIPNITKYYWRRIAEDETRAEFVTGRLVTGLKWLLFKQQEGKWQFSDYSPECRLRSVVGRGPVVTWALAEPKSTPKVTRRIRVIVRSSECSGGRPAGPRARLVFKKWGRKLLMTIWLKPLYGAQTCQGVIEPPLEVTLPSRIKLHRLYDGSTYPPRPAIKPTR